MRLSTLLLGLIAGLISAEESAPPVAPNPYHALDNWAQLPVDRKFGAVAAISIDSKGNLWVFERCGGNTCVDRPENPILKFNSSGKLVSSFGSGLFVFPHALYIDKADNIWVTDADGKNGKGHQVFKFSSDGQLLMTLGKAGIAGDGSDVFNRPTGVALNARGEIFVTDGHGGDSNARVMKFSPGGKFLKAWGRKGSGPGEFDTIHGVAIDSRGRVLIADRGNRRIQIFDSDGKFLEQWRQFGACGGLYIDRNDLLYAADNQSDGRAWKRGIRVGNAKTGKVTAVIPDPYSDPDPPMGIGAEGVVADRAGNIYAVEVARQMVKKYSK